MAIVFGNKIHIFIPKSAYGGGSTGLGIIPENQFFYCFPKILKKKKRTHLFPSKVEQQVELAHHILTVTELQYLLEIS